jgi:NAD(P)-dependent dehydrogenase (short-subunit alcohol dehydrogenase family)
MGRFRKFVQHFGEYRAANILAMIRNNGKYPEVCADDFHGRLVVITGATSGIGYVTARKYASHGANILCVNRNPDKSEALCREIESEYGVRCDFITADLSLLPDIHRAAEALSDLTERIDVLIHNAGVYLTRRDVTPDGIEKTFAVQYLSSFIINFVLIDKLKSQGKGRILLVNSEGHRFTAWGLRLDDLNWEKRRYTGLRSYGSAKTAQLLSMIVFDEHLRGTGVTINAMHPGAVRTETGRDNGPLYLWYKKHILERGFRPPEISADALYYLGVSLEVESVSGRFFNLTTEEEPAPPALDREVAYELWEKSLYLGGLRGEALKDHHG